MTSKTEDVHPENTRNLMQPEHRNLMVRPHASGNRSARHRQKDQKRHQDASCRKKRNRGQIPEPEAGDRHQDGYHGQELRCRQVGPSQIEMEAREDRG